MWLAITISVILVLAPQSFAGTQAMTSDLTDPSSGVQVKDAESEAERVWEQAIAAKGGREKLYAVRNMVVSSRWEYKSSSFKRVMARQEQVFVFPNKYWFWNDLRPDVFGLSVEMYNYDTNMYYQITPTEPHAQSVPIKDTQSPNVSLVNAQLFYLLETKWMKPTLVKASKSKIGLRAVDIVQTEINNERVDFAFDQETHLAVRISEYGNGTTRTSLFVQYLSNYAEINGIKIPLTLKEDEKDRADIMNIKINVDYDESIFVKPPPIETGPEAWRLKLNESKRD